MDGTDEPGTDVETYDPHLPAEDDVVDGEIVDEDQPADEDDTIDAEVDEPEDDAETEPPWTPPESGGGGGSGTGKKPQRRPKKKPGSGGDGGGKKFTFFNFNITLFSGNKAIEVKQTRRQGRPAPQRRRAGSGRK